MYIIQVIPVIGTCISTRLTGLSLALTKMRSESGSMILRESLIVS